MANFSAALPPKRPQLHGTYPLTKFRSYLEQRISLTTVPAYLAAVRRLLAALGEAQEDCGVRKAKTWQQPGAVQAYIRSIANIHTATVAAQAFTHWLAFTDSPPGLSATRRASRAEAACAFRVLLNARGRGVPSLPTEALAALHWQPSRADGTCWALSAPDIMESAWQLAPGLKEMGEIIRTWSTCGFGEPLLPINPNSRVPMNRVQVSAFLNLKVDSTRAARILHIAQEADVATMKKYFVQPLPSKQYSVLTESEKSKLPGRGGSIPTVRGDGYTVIGSGANQTIVYDRDAEYEDYVVPEDGPTEDVEEKDDGSL